MFGKRKKEDTDLSSLFGHGQIAQLRQMERRFSNLEGRGAKKDKGFVDSLDAIEQLLAKNHFNSEQVDSYYQLMQTGHGGEHNVRRYSVIVASILLFIASLYLLIGKIPLDLKGSAIFYFNYHDALTMSDLVGIILLFVSSLMFIMQMVKLSK